jgi:prophage regulatory protein
MNASDDESPSGALLRLWHVLRLVPVSRATLYRWIRAEKFPQGKHLSNRIVVWRREDVQDWIDRSLSSS